MFFTRPIPIPMEDDLVHTDTNPICADPTCSDKEDDDLMAEAAHLVAPYVQDGLMTPDEATRFTQGRQL